MKKRRSVPNEFINYLDTCSGTNGQCSLYLKSSKSSRADAEKLADQLRFFVTQNHMTIGGERLAITIVGRPAAFG
jgi:hypothetical protein